MRMLSLGRRVIFVSIVALCFAIAPLMMISRNIGAGAFERTPYYSNFHVPITIDDGKVYFFQPGYSLTVLDAESGRVLLRGDPIAPGKILTNSHIRVVGQLLLFDDYVLNNHTGRVVSDQFPSSSKNRHIGENYVVGMKHITLHNYSLQVVDIQKGSVRQVGRNSNYGDFCVSEPLLFALDEGSEESGATLLCFDLPTGEIRWSAELDRVYSDVGLLSGVLYAFSKDIKPGRPTGALAAFSFDGTRLPDVTPEQEQYGDLIAELAEYGKTASYSEDEKNKAIVRERFSDAEYVSAATLLPGNGIVGVSSVYPRFDGSSEWTAPKGEIVKSNHEILLFDDGEHHWERRVNCLGGNFLFFRKGRFNVDEFPEALREKLKPGSLAFINGDDFLYGRIKITFAANEKLLVYSTNSGKVECIERATGRSIWIYSYPRNDMGLWAGEFTSRQPRFSIANWWNPGRPGMAWATEKQGRLWWEALKHGRAMGIVFYEEDKALLEADLSTRWMMGVSVKEDAGPTYPPVTFDPNPPSMQFPETDFVAMVCRVLPFSAFLAIWLAATRRFAGYRRFLAICCLLGFNAWAFYAYGRYSFSAFSLMASSLMVLYFSLIVAGTRLFSSWALRPIRSHAERVRS